MATCIQSTVANLLIAIMPELQLATWTGITKSISRSGMFGRSRGIVRLCEAVRTFKLGLMKKRPQIEGGHEEALDCAAVCATSVPSQELIKAPAEVV